jgi:alpha-amylase/alpha-mannosidase (GH57 family)
VYRDNYGVLMAFHRDELVVPQELQVAAEIALGHRCQSLVRSLEQDIGEAELSLHHLAELEAVATEAKHLRCRLNIAEAKQTLEQLLTRSLWQLLHDSNPVVPETEIQRLERLIDLGYQLNLGLSLARAQELYFSCLHQIESWCLQAIQTQQGDENSGAGNSNENNWNIAQLRDLLRLGQKLGVDVSALLSQLV